MVDGQKQKEYTLSRSVLPLEWVGKKFGDFVVISRNKWRKNGHTYIEVRCPHEEVKANYSNLLRGRQLGCDLCYRERNNLPIFRDEEQRKLYKRVKSIILRCYNKGTNGYENYGGRGITIHQEWLDNLMLMVNYLEALPNYSLTKQIDRIDNDGNYAPGNLRWVSAKDNAYNRGDVTLVEWEGATYTVKDWLIKFYDGSQTRGREQFDAGVSLVELAAYKNQAGRLKENSNRRNLLYVEWNNERIHFSDFVEKYTKLSYVQANRYRRKGWSLARIAAHQPRSNGTRV